MTPTSFLIYGKRGVFNSSALVFDHHHRLRPKRLSYSARRATSGKFRALVTQHSSLITTPPRLPLPEQLDLARAESAASITNLPAGLGIFSSRSMLSAARFLETE